MYTVYVKAGKGETIGQYSADLYTLRGVLQTIKRDFSRTCAGVMLTCEIRNCSGMRTDSVYFKA